MNAMDNKHNIGDLRGHLFATLEALRDKSNPMDLDRAKAIAGVAQVVVDSARVEVEFAKAVGGTGTGFIEQPRPLGQADNKAISHPQPGVTQHRLR